jgi:hypothetical protein
MMLHSMANDDDPERVSLRNRQAHGTHQRPTEQIGCFAAKDSSHSGFALGSE